MRERLLGQPLDIFNIAQATYFVKMALLNPKQLKIITLNPEMIVTAEKRIDFQSAINNANLIVADGTGLTWALKKLNPGKYEDFERVPGIELAEKIIISANDLSKKVAIYGGSKEVLDRIVNVLPQKYPKIDIVKTIDGFTSKNELDVAKEISYENPNVVLVALGSPKQELWIEKYSYLFPKSIMIGIGGTLDVWSGKKERAPEWMRKAHIEWLYRVLSEPKRIPRLLKSHPVFIYKVFKAGSH